MLIEASITASDEYRLLLDEHRQLLASMALLDQDEARFIDDMSKSAITLGSLYADARSTVVKGIKVKDFDLNEVGDKSIRALITAGMGTVTRMLAASEEFAEYRDLAAINVQQATCIVQALHDIICIWPWTDSTAIERAQDQSTRGELMDLETFANGLRGV
ncbi:MAG: hypothetical protein QGG71_26500 [Pirellulaceae bacterium]|jgi:hypothetical protein|nr:hypothetical protein [Pirellulaceae bacterium]